MRTFFALSSKLGGFFESISLDLMHTRHWTEQPEARVDANVNNLVVYRAEGVMARAVPEMRFLNQPAGATVRIVTNDILRKEFVVVKHSDERVQKLIQRGYTEKVEARQLRLEKLVRQLIFHSTMWEKKPRSKRVKRRNRIRNNK